MLVQTHGRRKGAAAAELAVLLPFLVFLLLATIDFGRAFYYSLTVANCARNGAMYLSNPSNIGSPYASLQAAVLADATNLSPAPQVNSPQAQTDANGYTYYDVTVTYTFQMVTKFPGLPSSVPISSTVRMTVPPTTPQ